MPTEVGAAPVDWSFGAAERQVTVVLGVVVGVLIASRYLGSASDADWLVSALDGAGFDRWAARLDHALHESVHRDFNRRAYFAGFRIVVYLGPAFVVGRWVLRRPMHQLGWRVDTRWRHIRVYVALLALMVPVVLLASTQESFQDTYPFYRPNDAESVWPWFVGWELLYFGQFVALELFFRGFGVHGLAPRLGVLAVVVMVVPYVTIHFGKPMPEAIASIVAGTVLGILSLRQGSALWGGVLHWSVALMMDVLAY